MNNENAFATPGVERGGPQGNGRTAQNENVIVIKDLTKQFDDVTAVNGLNLYYFTGSLSVIFHTGSLVDPVIWQNLLILAIISLVIVVAGIQLFKRTGDRYRIKCVHTAGVGGNQ